MNKDNITNANDYEVTHIFNQIVTMIDDKLTLPHHRVNRKKAIIFYYGYKANNIQTMIKRRHWIIRLFQGATEIRIDFNHHLIEFDSIQISSLKGSVHSFSELEKTRSISSLFIPYNDFEHHDSILSKLVNSVGLLTRNKKQHNKMNKRMNSLQSEQIMSVKKHYESQICPTYSKPK